MPSRTIGRLWGGLQNFHRTVWKAGTGRTSPKGPVEAPVNRTIRRALAKRTILGQDIERQREGRGDVQWKSRWTIHGRITLSRMAESLTTWYEGTLLQRQTRVRLRSLQMLAV
ncbi:hypothetical protein ACMFMG_012012 [Clarireedia jacksonii]